MKERSRESYDTIEKGLVTIERQRMPARPDVDQISATVTSVMTEYNKIVAQATKEARDTKSRVKHASRANRSPRDAATAVAPRSDP